MSEVKKPFRIRVIETRQYEFEVWSADGAAAKTAGMKIWCEADTVGQWEVDGTDYEYDVSEITYEPHWTRYWN